MFKTDVYIPALIELLKAAYKERLLYVGLQGSYLRNEATDHSDIDIMVVIRDMSVADLAKYREAISSLEDYDKSCGFICGIEELKNWNPLEICHLLHTTKDYYGTLSFAYDWLKTNQQVDGTWDMGAAAKDGVYFPLSDRWDKTTRITGSTHRIGKLISLPCYCGHDCARCITYIATLRNDENLRRQSQSFYIERFGLDIPLEKFNCEGGRSKNVFELCKECPFVPLLF